MKTKHLLKKNSILETLNSRKTLDLREGDENIEQLLVLVDTNEIEIDSLQQEIDGIREERNLNTDQILRDEYRESAEFLNVFLEERQFHEKRVEVLEYIKRLVTKEK